MGKVIPAWRLDEIRTAMESELSREWENELAKILGNKFVRRDEMLALVESYSQEPVSAQKEEFLIRQLTKYRNAGCGLAEAAARVVKEYDGLHRLSMAIANWYQAIADEFDRDLLHRTREDENPATENDPDCFERLEIVRAEHDKAMEEMAKELASVKKQLRDVCDSKERKSDEA